MTGPLFRGLSAFACLALGATLSCTTPFPATGSGERILVGVIGGELGAPGARLPIPTSTPRTYRLNLLAQRRNGALDEAFNRYLRVSVNPGTVVALRGATVAGRNIRLTGGQGEVEVDITGAFGDARFWVEDVGYAPGDTSGERPPACADGLDNDGDNLIDFPSDPGCFAANDDSEEGGTHAVGTSTTLFFAQPRISDVLGGQSGGPTPFKGQEVFLDTGWRVPEPDPANPGALTPERFDFDVVITRISASGFYVTDLGPSAARDAASQEDPSRPPGYPFASLFSFTFSAPGGLRVCDRIRAQNGTATEFFGQVQLSSPSFVIEPWNPEKRPCLVPEPFRLLPRDLDPENQTVLARHKGGLVRVATEGPVAVSVARHFGRGYPAAPDYLPTEDASNCDFDGNGTVEFNAAVDAAEAACSAACAADPECAEFSAFAARGSFMLTVREGDVARKVQANAFASPAFRPLAQRGQPVRAFSGTLNFFSGGSQYTIEARCDDDAVSDLASTPKASGEACVRPRTLQDTNENSQ